MVSASTVERSLVLNRLSISPRDLASATCVDNLAFCLPCIPSDPALWLLSNSAGSVDEFVALKREYIRAKEDYIPDVSRWWANGNMICNVESPGFWGDAYLPQLRHMLQTLCANRVVPDCEFFVNKRDFPQLKVCETGIEHLLLTIHRL
jgi:hypothetical protein